MTPLIAITSSVSGFDLRKKAIELAQQLNIPYVDVGNEVKLKQSYDFLLMLTEDHLMLLDTKEKLGNPIYVDFMHPPLEYRRRNISQRDELIAKAVGIKPGYRPHIVDATAGLGQDSFILANLGCPVISLERSPIIFALLEDGVSRWKHAWESFATNKKVIQDHANTSASENSHVNKVWQLFNVDTIDYLNSLKPSDYPEVIFLDPMYPTRNKSALNKKEMRFLRVIVGDDPDIEQLFAIALMRAKKRVVVKRPRLTAYIGGKKPHHVILGKSSRFDIYA